MIKKKNKLIKGLLFTVITGSIVFFSSVTWVGYSMSKDVPLGKVEVGKIKTFEKSKDYGDKVEYVTQEDYLKNKVSQEEASFLFSKSGRGTLYVEDIGATIPVYEGTDSKTLYYGVGTANPNQQEGLGNFTVIGHNMFNGTIFTYLGKVNTGTKAYLTDFKNTYTYKIVNKQSVHQSQGQLMNDPLKPIESEVSKKLENTLRSNTKEKEDFLKNNSINDIKTKLSYTPTLTMISCDGGVGTTQRWVVTAELESVTENKDLPKEKQESLSVDTTKDKGVDITNKKDKDRVIKVNDELSNLNLFQRLFYYFTTGLKVIGLTK